MLGNEKLLFDELYEKTKDCGRVQFVKLLMTKEKENQELKKQLEEKTKIGISDHKYASKCEDKVIVMKNQQKEFINYLEDKIKSYKSRDSYMVADILGSYDLNNIELELVEEILQKYKEIIGLSDEKKRV